MINKAIKILSALLLIGLSLYVVTQNSASITVYLTPGWSISANTGVILIIVFVLGLIVSAVVAAYFALKAGLRERRLWKKEQERQAFYNTMLEARSLFAAGEWRKARALWEHIIKRDPSHVIAYVELSRSLEEAGDIAGALRVIDTARMQQPGNIEILFRAAELNLSLGNRTAAIDNLALVLYHMPSLKAARMARDLSEELGRLHDAFEYQEKAEGYGEEEAASAAARTRLEFKKLLAEEGEDFSQNTSALRAFLKRHGDYPPALERLAAWEAQNGKVEDAAQLLIRAAKAWGDQKYWNQASKLWIENNLADRALAAARSSARGSSGTERIRAELYLIRLLLQLGKLEEAQPLLDALPRVVAENKLELAPCMHRQAEILRALYLALSGECRAAAGVLQELAAEA